MSHRGAWPITVAAAAAGLLALGAAAATAATGPATATAPKWRAVVSVKTVGTNATNEFTAVVATGKTTAWAFDESGFAYQLSGGTWKKASYPAKEDEEVITAAATSPSDVWAFTEGFGTVSRVLHYNGHAWSVVKTFSLQIASASVLAANDVWVYGSIYYPNEPVLGVWHYNGSTWTQLSTTIQGGSVLSASNVWGFRGTDVEHWNGAKWTATSVKSLLPPTSKNIINDPQVTGILALSATNVYAIGNGTEEDEGGPLVVLHYNGSKWSRLGEGNFGFDAGPEFSYDGSGGLWIPMFSPAAGDSYLVHYSAGKLTLAALPVPTSRITVWAVSQVPGTTQQLAAGYEHASGLGTNLAAVLLKYS